MLNEFTCQTMNIENVIENEKNSVTNFHWSKRERKKKTPIPITTLVLYLLSLLFIAILTLILFIYNLFSLIINVNNVVTIL